MADEDKRKHLEMIQGVVARLAGNSFSIKGWAVALIAVLGGFAAKDANPRFVLGLWLPVLCFWGLDAYYLRQEKLFRKLYDAAVKGDANSPLYSMNTQPFEAELGSVIKLAFSRTVLWLHIPIVLFVLALSSYSLFHICRQKAVSHPAQSAMSGTKPSFQLINFAASESICTATVWSIRSGTRNTSAIMRAAVTNGSAQATARLCLR